METPGEQDGDRRGAKRARDQEAAQAGPRVSGAAERRSRPGLGLQLDSESRRATVIHRVINFAPDPLPVRQYDKDTTQPISFYLSGLEELLAWKPTSDDAFNVSTEPLAKRQPPLDSHRPRTLVCHDMKGGYIEDRFIQGTAVQNPYVFYHLHYIDIFVYFSHHTVTIPPVVWTNAAHRNGVLMLGTFITEWTDGGKICEAFLAGGEEAYQAVADQLAMIAQFYRFDGWLINIENSLSVTAARNMPHFLQYLTAQVHRLVPGGQVVWYDSVLQSGELQWQNELNENNRCFFDVCDGFFTNYNWKEENLVRTVKMAGDRQQDIYVGIDVFGRGEVVSSGFETEKSLRMIREHGLSVAIFAPGWVYEHLGSEDFMNNEDKFWALLSSLLPIHSVGSLPFNTTFNLGVRNKHFLNGQENEMGPWYNLSGQAIQPLYTNHRTSSDGWVRTRCCLQDAWCGGSSLLIEGAIAPKVSHITARLFSFQMPAPPKLLVVLIYKQEAQFQAVTLVPELTTKQSHSGNVTGLPAAPRRHRPQPLDNPPPQVLQLIKGCGQDGEHGWQSRCYELELQNSVLDELFVTVSHRQSGQSEVPFAFRLGRIWGVQLVLIQELQPTQSPQEEVPSPNLVDGHAGGERVPGGPRSRQHLELKNAPLTQVLNAGHLRSLTSVSTGSQISSIDVAHLHWHQTSARVLSLSLTLRWTYPPNKANCFRLHCRKGSCVESNAPPLHLIGEAHAPVYRITQLIVPEPQSETANCLEFLVEPVPDTGIQIDAALWGKLILIYSEPKLPNTGSGTSD